MQDGYYIQEQASKRKQQQSAIKELADSERNTQYGRSGTKTHSGEGQ
jgi:hypothetical protein